MCVPIRVLNVVDDNDTLIHRSAVVGSLYLAGFAQMGAPHAAIILAASTQSGEMAHITTKSRSGSWAYDFRSQKIQGSVTLTSLIKIRDASKGSLTKETLNAIFSKVPVPPGDENGECMKWVKKSVQLLAEHKIVNLVSADSLEREFSTFCAGNRSYATSSKYPNVMTSSYCS